MSKETRPTLLIGYLLSIIAYGVVLLWPSIFLSDITLSASVDSLRIFISITTMAFSILGLVTTFMPAEKSWRWRWVCLVAGALDLVTAIFIIAQMELHGGDAVSYLEAFALASGFMVLLAGFFRF